MKKTNNKGFSLVELIIVIAIMAILIGVLAPQYMKYVEKSRVSADKDTLDSVYNACTVASADPESQAGEPTTTNSSFTTVTVPTSGSWISAVQETLGGMTISQTASKLKSKSAGATKSIQIQVDNNQNYRVIAGSLTVPEK